MRRLSLSSQTLLLQLTIIAFVLLVVGAVTYRNEQRSLRAEAEQRALTIAESVAAVPTVVEAFDEPHPWLLVRPLAEAIREASDVDAVVIANDQGIRYSHPDWFAINEPMDVDVSGTLEGEPGIYLIDGELGLTVQGRAPITGPQGRVIGLVAVDILLDDVDAQLAALLPRLVLSLAAALALGGFGAWALARRLRRQTCGMEPEEIARLFEHRVAMLKSMREGVLAVGRDGRVHLLNQEARRLLDLPEDAEGRLASDLLPPGTICDLVESREHAEDVIARVGERVLVMNQTPTEVRGERVGAVLTMRDRTELERLLRELSSIRGIADALRAQAHEHSNQLHTVAGLLELGRREEAIALITETTTDTQAVATFTDRIGDPVVAGLLVAKAALAQERGIRLRIGERTRFEHDLREPRDILTIIGNLVDNAMEALTSVTDGRELWVEVTIVVDDQGTEITVEDSGPGVPAPLRERILEEGFSTKAEQQGVVRGVGLSLVAAIVQRRAGELHVDGSGRGAVFTVTLPRRTALLPAGEARR